MNKLVLAIALSLIVPAIHAQQAETSGSPPQTAPLPTPQPAAQNQNAQDNLPASIRPGHPLDPADVDVLTGKRDREIEAAQRAAICFIRISCSEVTQREKYSNRSMRSNDSN